MQQMSLEELRAALADELLEKFGTDSYGSPLYNIVATFPDYLIARGPNADLYRIGFTVADGSTEPGEDVDIQLGDPQEVEVAYVPVSESASFLASEAGANASEDGWSWPVRIIEAGPARGSISGAPADLPHSYSPGIVAEFAGALNNARFGRRHPGPMDTLDDPARIAGWFSEGKLVGTAAHARLNLFKTEEGIRQKLLAAREAKKLDLFGLSVLAYCAFKNEVVGGQKVLVAETLGKLVSVDFVTEPGAGGRFLQVAASNALLHEISTLQQKRKKTSPSATGAGRNKGAAMKQRILQVIEALRKHDTGRATTLTAEFAALSEDKYGDFLLTVSEAVTTSAAQLGANADSVALVTEARTMLDEAKKLRSKNLVDARLINSKLPVPAQSLVREHLKDLIVDEAAIDGEIKRVREAFAAYSAVGQVTGVRVGLETVDKVQAAMDAMLGVKEAQKDPNVKPFRGVKEAYVFITGDAQMNFGKSGSGGFTRVTEAVATSDFPNILLNSMTKRLIQDYAEVGLNGLENLITVGPALSDYKTQDRVRDGYFGDLPTVAEAGPYLELAKPTDERISYTPAKKGGLLTISEETIRNDDLGAITRFPQRLARAGRHTLKTFVTNFFVNNPNYLADGVAWFHATHTNLITNPLAVDTLTSAEVALMKQSEKDSNNRLGFRVQWLMVPVDLAAQAWQLNNAQFYNPGPALQLPNPFYQRFGPKSEYIIVNELLTDTNDWYYGVLPQNVPFLEVGYLDGIQEPQIFLASLATQGTQFTNDQIQYKTKFVFGGAIIDFRPVAKAVVP